ncbi:MAG: PH domain-containing protein [Thalassotalea sp.]
MPLSSNNFANSSIFPTELPNIEGLKQQVLAPVYAKARLALAIFWFSLPLLIGIIALKQSIVPLPEPAAPVIQYILFAIAILAALVITYIFFADKHKKYALRDLDLHYSSGLIFRKTVSQPILRIQHVELKRGPIDRKVGLAKLQVFSAGGALHTFEIPGLPVADAESVRQFILSHKDANTNG